MNLQEANQIYDSWKASHQPGACVSCGYSADACHCGDYVDSAPVPEHVLRAVRVINVSNGIGLSPTVEEFRNFFGHDSL